MTAADPSPYLPFLLSGAASALDARAWLLGRHHATLAAAATRGPLDDHLHAYDRWSRPDLPEGVVIHLDARCGGAKAPTRWTRRGASYVRAGASAATA